MTRPARVPRLRHSIADACAAVAIAHAPHFLARATISLLPSHRAVHLLPGAYDTCGTCVSLCKLDHACMGLWRRPRWVQLPVPVPMTHPFLSQKS